MWRAVWLVLLVACGANKRFVELSNEGVTALGRHDDATARTAFREAVKLEPDDPEVNYYLGTLALREDKPEEAVARLTVATAAQPPWPDALSHLAHAQHAAKRSKDAVATLHRLFQVDAGHPAGHVLAGRIALEVADRTSADQHFRAAIAGDAGFAPAYVELAKLYGEVAAYDPARLVLEQGLRFAPESPELLEALGLAWLDLGRPDRARAAFEQATRLANVRYQAYLNLAAAKIGRAHV